MAKAKRFRGTRVRGLRLRVERRAGALILVFGESLGCRGATDAEVKMWRTLVKQQREATVLRNRIRDLHDALRRSATGSRP